jgi:hypothetical protein
MKYRVFWSPDAESQLEKILSDRLNRDRLVSVARSINLYLATSPIKFSESRSASLRIGFATPLCVLFEVLQDVSTVIVYEVWRTDLHRN